MGEGEGKWRVQALGCEDMRCRTHAKKSKPKVASLSRAVLPSPARKPSVAKTPTRPPCQLYVVRTSINDRINWVHQPHAAGSKEARQTDGVVLGA